jgi:hypothetical protein
MDLFQQKLFGIFLIFVFTPSKCLSFQTKYSPFVSSSGKRNCKFPPHNLALLPPELENIVRSTFSEKLIDELSSVASDQLTSIVNVYDQAMQQVQQQLAPYTSDLKINEALHWDKFATLASDFKTKFEPLYESLMSQFGIDKLVAIIPPRLGPAIDVMLLCLFTAVLYSTTGGSIDAPKSPYPMGKYDPYTSKMYFQNRLGESFGRALYITLLSASFLFNIALDAAR